MLCSARSGALQCSGGTGKTLTLTLLLTTWQIMRAFYKGPVEDIPCTGPAPVLIRTDLLRKVLPAWEEITKGIEVRPTAMQNVANRYD